MLLKSSVDKWQLPQQSGYGAEIEQLKKALLQQQRANQPIGAGGAIEQPGIPGNPTVAGVPGAPPAEPDFLSSLKKLMDGGSNALGAAKLFFGGM